MQKETSGHAFISSKPDLLAFTEWAVFLGPLPIRNSFHFAHNEK